MTVDWVCPSYFSSDINLKTCFIRLTNKCWLKFGLFHNLNKELCSKIYLGVWRLLYFWFLIKYILFSSLSILPMTKRKLFKNTFGTVQLKNSILHWLEAHFLRCFSDIYCTLLSMKDFTSSLIIPTTSTTNWSWGIKEHF